MNISKSALITNNNNYKANNYKMKYSRVEDILRNVFWLVRGFLIYTGSTLCIIFIRIYKHNNHMYHVVDKFS